MNTLNEWLRTIAATLGDDEPGAPFQRYAVKDMMAALNSALCLVAKYRPDLFTELRNIKLQPGKYQDVRGCCANVLGVLEQTDERGNIIKEVSSSRATTTKVSRVWKKESCIKPIGLEYAITNVIIDPSLNGRFEVFPPVPCGVEAYALVKCVRAPCSYTNRTVDFDGDCTMHTAAWHYVLATMLAGDRFEANNQQSSQYHYRMFFDILGVVQKQEDRIESREKAT